MKTLATIIGFILLALGVACFIPGLADNGQLFGRFPVSTPMAIAFIVTGVVGLVIGLSHRRPLDVPRSPDGRDLRDL